MQLNVKEIKEAYQDFSAKFSNHLLQLLIGNAKRDDNIAVSPSRMQTVLVILAHWVEAKVKRQILDLVWSDVMELKEADVLCSKERLIIEPLSEDNDFYGEVTNPVIELSTILWIQENMRINKGTFLDLSLIYDLMVKRVDFTNPKTKTIIDASINEASHGLIPGIDATIDSKTLILLTDVLYFKTLWEEPFDKENTDEQFFYGTKGKIKVPMMHKKGVMPYRETSKYQMVVLRYQGMTKEEKSLIMRICLPKKGVAIDDVINDHWNNGFNDEMDEEHVKLSLPRFTVQTNINMKDALKQLGLECIFNSTDVMPELAKNLQVSDIVQQVKVIVNEEETEAAALTYMCCIGSAPPSNPIKPFIMRVNRPFLFEIAEENSKTILFTGVINSIK